MKLATRKKVSNKKKYHTPYELHISKVNIDNLGGWSISYEMIKWILKNVPINSTILELGSGNGSFELSKFYILYSVEHDIKWCNKYTNVNYICAPLIDDWYDTEILKNNMPKKYDLLIVDGPIQEKRLNLLKNLDIFDFTGLIIIDDTNREGDNEMANFICKEFNKESIMINCDNKNFKILK